MGNIQFQIVKVIITDDKQLEIKEKKKDDEGNYSWEK